MGRRRRREARAAAATPVAPPAGPAANLKTLAVLGLILSCLAGPIGIVVSLVALVRSRLAGERNAVAVAGLVVGIATTAAFVGGILYFHAVLTGDTGVCAELGPGTHDGTLGPFTCPAS